MGRRVLVARPQPGADATARRLEQLGFAPVLLPLTEIRSLPVDSLPTADGVDAVALTSVNALRHAPRQLTTAFARKPCFGVGAETAAAARNAGFSHVLAGTGDAAGLAWTILGALPPGARILYPCGRVRLSAFEDLLRAGGMIVEALEIYDAPDIAYSPGAVLSVFGGAPVDAVLLHSAKAAARLAELAREPEVRRLLSRTEFLCLTERIGAALSGISDGRVFFAETPDEAALLALLGRRCGAGA